MTYKQLAERISKMDSEQLDSDVTVMNEDEEFFTVRLRFNDANGDGPASDVLDDKHPYFELKTFG
jgi:hypothetical protein